MSPKLVPENIVVKMLGAYIHSMNFATVTDAESFIVENQIAGRKFEVTDLTPELVKAAKVIALNWIAPSNGYWANNFMYDMKTKAMGKGLSAGQAKGVLNVVRAEAKPAAPVAAKADLELNVAKVRTARFRVVPDDGQSIAIRLSVPTMWTDAPKGTRKLSVRQADGWSTVGKISPEGGVQVFKKAGPALEARIRQALFILANADDDLVFILDYAMDGSECGFCGKELDTVESLTVGYGPSCAKKNDLPWGAKAIPAKVALAKAGLAPAEAEVVTVKAGRTYDEIFNGQKADYDLAHDTDGAVITGAGVVLRPLAQADPADDLAAAADLANDVAVGN
jgi:hypothetical protein